MYRAIAMTYAQDLEANTALGFAYNLCQLSTRVYPPTCSECPTDSHTLGGTLCRHNVVVSGASYEVLGEDDGGHSAQSGGGVPASQVSI